MVAILISYKYQASNYEHISGDWDDAEIVKFMLASSFDRSWDEIYLVDDGDVRVILNDGSFEV